MTPDQQLCILLNQRAIMMTLRRMTTNTIHNEALAERLKSTRKRIDQITNEMWKDVNQVSKDIIDEAVS